MLEDGRYQTRTKMPTHVEDETPFIVWQELKLSLRQVLTLFLGLVIWYMAVKVTTTILPFLSGIFAYLMWSWIVIGAFALAFLKRHGMPMEQYLASKIAHSVSPQYYVPMDEAAEHGSIDETFWEDER